MKFSQNAVLHSTAEQAADILYQAGIELDGKPLRRASWQEIAQVILDNKRLSTVLLMRLRVAKNREDALRVLRMARKRRANQRHSRSAKGRPARQPGRVLIKGNQADLEHDEFSELYWEGDGWYYHQHQDFEEWQAIRLGQRGRTLEYPPVSPVQEMVLRLADERQREEDDTTVRAAIGEETYQQLLALTDGRQVVLTTAEEAFFAEHDLHYLLETGGARPVHDGMGLVGMDIITRHGVPTSTFQVQWMAVSHWFGRRLQQEPDTDLAGVINGLLIFVEQSPSDPARLLLERFCRDEKVHPAWLPLLPCFLPRLPQLLPNLDLGNAANGFKLEWISLLIQGIGSALVLHQMQDNLKELLDGKARVHTQRAGGVHRLLALGAGSLRGQSYPVFTLTARPVVSLVAPQTAQALWELYRALHEGAIGLHQQPTRAFTDLMRLAFDSTATPPLLWDAILSALVAHATGYVMLVAVIHPGETFRIRRKHVRRFWEQHEAGELTGLQTPWNLETLIGRFGVDRLIEGLTHALLSLFNDRWLARDGTEISLKEPFILALRTLALHYRGADLTQPLHIALSNLTPEMVRTIADILVRQSLHAPLELAQGLGIGHEQGLPLLHGGRMTDWEHRTRHTLREAAGGMVRQESSQPARRFTCRPLSKAAALDRGDLGGDCSSQAVPLRCLSPHHIYYGVWEDDKQQRGYMTVFESWAEGEEGERLPVLCLETINVPIPIFDAVQQDLLLIFDAIAQSRGLSTPIAMTTGLNTWNYQNGTILSRSRRFRQGERINLFPGDGVAWRLYVENSREGGAYSSFHNYRGSGNIRILAPFDPAQDVVQPENVAEAERLAALPAQKLFVTMRGETGLAGFISSLPRS